MYRNVFAILQLIRIRIDRNALGGETDVRMSYPCTSAGLLWTVDPEFSAGKDSLASSSGFLRPQLESQSQHESSIRWISIVVVEGKDVRQASLYLNTVSINKGTFEVQVYMNKKWRTRTTCSRSAEYLFGILRRANPNVIEHC